MIINVILSCNLLRTIMQQRPRFVPPPSPKPNNTFKAGTDQLSKQFALWANGASRRLQSYFQEIILRARQPVDTIYSVALQRISEGAYEDALMRLHFVVRRRPDNVDAWYYLGSCAMEVGNIAEAVTAFRKTLALKPTHDEARFLLTVLEPDALPRDQQPKFAPLDLAASHFDSLAEYYESDNLGDLGYTGHSAIAASVRKYLNPNYKNFQILDLGCGTGLVGPLFRDIAGYIAGIDISPLMLEHADLKRDALARKIYDELILKDLRQVLLEGRENTVDLILAANVFPYVGGLTPVFEGAKRVLKPGGVLAFSVETVEGNDFGLIPGEGRFAHSHSYIMGLAQNSGFDLLEAQSFPMFREEEGVEYVFRKPTPPQPQQAAPQPQTPPVAGA